MTRKSLFLIGLVTLLPLLLWVSPVVAVQTTFYFHNYQELSLSIAQLQIGSSQIPQIYTSPGSGSARAFGYATPDPPASGGISTTLSSQIYVSGSQSGYTAVVGWVTNPFPVKVNLDGDVVMHVWMSSNDGLWPWQGSLYFMGMADYTPGNPDVQILWTYASNGQSGNVLSTSPLEYTASLHISQHDFQAGNMLMFFAGAGSNKKGWQFDVYFGSQAWNSRAEIPADSSLTVSEFRQPAAVFPIAFVILCGGIVTLRFSSRRVGRRHSRRAGF